MRMISVSSSQKAIPAEEEAVVVVVVTELEAAKPERLVPSF